MPTLFIQINNSICNCGIHSCVGTKVKLYTSTRQIILRIKSSGAAGEKAMNGFCLGINPRDIANLIGFVRTREPLDVSYYNNNKMIYIWYSFLLVLS